MGIKSGSLDREPFRFQVPGKGFEGRRVASIDDDMRARPGQRPGHGRAQMAAAAGNKGGFAVQTE